MTDGQSQTPKSPSKGFLERLKSWLRKTFSRSHSLSTSPQPSASGQENPAGDLSSVQRTIVSPGSGSPVAHDQHNTPTQDGAGSVSPTQPHGTVADLSETQAHPENSTSPALSTENDIDGAAWSFTEMLLERLPDAVDTNPAKIAVGIVKIVLQIKDEVRLEGNVDAVDRRILSTVNQLRTLEEALTGWAPNNAEENQGIELYKTTLAKEWTNLIELKKQLLMRRIAVHEEDKGKIADAFDRINRAREQLVVATGLGAHKTVLAIQEDVAKLLLEQLKPSHAADYKSELEGEQRLLLRRAVCMPGTHVRILGDIARWANDTSSESQSVYWLSGQGGSGKSIIAYTIARRFEFAGDADDTIVLGGNFFCLRQIRETRSATCIIRTIVYHLALKCKAFADALHASGKFDTIHHSVRAQLESLLMEPWKQAQSADPSKSLNFLVVIDALNEIDGTGGSEFLRELLDVINKNCLRGLKFFVTSRPDLNLITHLGSFEDKQVMIGEAQADITTYLNANLVWDASAGDRLKELKGHTNSVRSVAFSPDGKHIVSGSDDDSVRVWDASTGNELKELKGHTDSVTSVAFSPDGNHIVSGSDDNSVWVWDVLTGDKLKELKGHTDWVRSVRFSPDGKHIVSGSYDHSVQVWDASTGNKLKELKGHTNSVTSVTFSPDGKHIVSGSGNNSVRVWDASTGDELKVLKGHTNWVRSVAFSPDAKHIISGSDDNSVRIWDASMGNELKELKGHTDSVTSVAFSPDGKHIVSGSDDNSVRVWDVLTGDELKELKGHTDWVRSVAFSPDGKHIVSGSGDSSVRVWGLGSLYINY